MRKNPPNASGDARPRAAGRFRPHPPPSMEHLWPLPLSGRDTGPEALSSTYTGWEHSCALQARRMALGFGRALQKARCTILWSSFRRQPYFVNWDPEDRVLEGAQWGTESPKRAWGLAQLAAPGPFSSLLLKWCGGWSKAPELGGNLGGNPAWCLPSPPG
jgi:hypothetical protein